MARLVAAWPTSLGRRGETSDAASVTRQGGETGVSNEAYGRRGMVFNDKAPWAAASRAFLRASA